MYIILAHVIELYYPAAWKAISKTSKENYLFNKGDLSKIIFFLGMGKFLAAKHNDGTYFVCVNNGRSHRCDWVQIVDEPEEFENLMF